MNTSIDFAQRTTQEFILDRMIETLDMPQSWLGGIRKNLAGATDSIQEASYQAYKEGTLDACETLTMAKN